MFSFLTFFSLPFFSFIQFWFIYREIIIVSNSWMYISLPPWSSCTLIALYICMLSMMAMFKLKVFRRSTTTYTMTANANDGFRVDIVTKHEHWIHMPFFLFCSLVMPENIALPLFSLIFFPYILFSSFGCMRNCYN